MTVPRFDRLIVHKFDPLTPAPGGIDTCIRGILKYATNAGFLAVVGVDGTGGKAPGRKLGEWERHSLGGREFYFLPVATLDPGNQVRRLPHSVTVACGLLRFKSRIPRPSVVQAHRADLGLLVAKLWPRASHAYFIHTQESGLLGSSSDSFWRRAGWLHRRLERNVVRSADAVRVFNPEYAELVRTWSSRAKFSPTWWDPELVRPHVGSGTGKALLWVGRLERPKQPLLAVEAVSALLAVDGGWHLTIVGTGNLQPDVVDLVARRGLTSAITLLGRVRPEEVMEQMAAADVFLMTSVVGYEGFPRVLTEALASGLPAIVTAGADTGRLVVDGSNGYQVEPDPDAIAHAVISAGGLGTAAPQASVAALSAPLVIERLYAPELD